MRVDVQLDGGAVAVGRDEHSAEWDNKGRLGTVESIE